MRRGISAIPQAEPESDWLNRYGKACDHHGMYAVDETFDMWYNRKTKFDCGADFFDCW